MKYAHYQIFACLILSSLFISKYSSADPATTTTTTRHKLVIASSNNFPPINLLDENGKLTGFARDLSSAVAREMNMDVEYIHSDKWSEVQQWLIQGKADLIHDTGYNIERDKFLDYTQPIIEMPETIFVRNETLNINSIRSLTNRKVACVNQHITHLYLKKFHDIKCHVVNTPAEGLIALVNKDVDAFIYPEQIASYLSQQLNLSTRIKTTGEPLRVLSWSMTVKQGNTQLVEQLNKGITAVKTSGEYQRIYDKWFGKKLFSGYSKQQYYLVTVIAVVLSVFMLISLGLLIYVYYSRKTQNLLRESRRKYRTLADSLPLSVFFKDLDSNYDFCNQYYADLLGIKPSQIVGKTDFDFHPDNAEIYRAGDQQVIKTGKTIEFVESYIKDGEALIVQTHKSPVYNNKGELVGVLGVFWDITQQTQLQNQLAKNIYEHRAITDTVPDIIYKLDLENRLVWWNRQLEVTTGLTASQLENMPMLELVAENDREAFAKAIKQLYESDKTSIEACLDTTNGEQLFDFQLALLSDNHDILQGSIGAGRDITLQKQAEQERHTLQSQLIQAQKMESIGQLTGGIAHDFNNMLTCILGYSQLSLKLENTSQNPTLERYLNEIINAGKRARDLVQQMLAFARINKSEQRKVDIRRVVESSLNLLRPMIPSSINITSSFVSEIPSITGDPVQLQQVLVNFCINARDAMEGKTGSIHISVDQSKQVNAHCNSCFNEFNGDFIVLSISDTGSGIPEKILDKIFDPFFTTKEVGKGSGMGLSMIHGIIHEHGGHIIVESGDKGTTFSVYLPINHSPVA